ncbi:MAG: hypothetical protein R3C53_15615 [Pirellulaceae bacterium]
MIPNQRAPVEIAAAVLPIIAFFVRFNVGRQCISSNNCRGVTRRLQTASLCIGILVLVLVDAVMILTHVMPKGAAFATMSDIVVWIVMYSIYVAAMSIAMYPGAATRLEDLSIADRGRTSG